MGAFGLLELRFVYFPYNSLKIIFILILFISTIANIFTLSVHVLLNIKLIRVYTLFSQYFNFLNL